MTTSNTATFVRPRVQLVVDVELHESHTAEGFTKALQNEMDWSVSHYFPAVELVCVAGRKATMTVEANFDMIPGWGYEAADWKNHVASHLTYDGKAANEYGLPLSSATVTIAE